MTDGENGGLTLARLGVRVDNAKEDIEEIKAAIKGIPVLCEQHAKDLQHIRTGLYELRGKLISPGDWQDAKARLGALERRQIDPDAWKGVCEMVSKDHEAITAMAGAMKAMKALSILAGVLIALLSAIAAWKALAQ